ncbi:hypothetical protein [Acanthopleuribacter pedis]|uniref:Uncharacterized protein n=1 Tax=Acanthopleuribacter pedis TaxID=442870 RepID=A0A8J7Q926_9BACT|nr:hypothetical protein [Acanthopleuribacter pedis]MBO1319174.1 hypothetical protein [Acanthopleuribacter pedis]
MTALIAVGCYRESGEDVLPVTATRITNDVRDQLPTGKESSGRIGDYLLSNAQIMAVVNGSVDGSTRDHYLAQSGGAVLDFTTVTLGADRRFRSFDDDGLHLLTQTVNMSRNTPIGYERIEIVRDGESNAALRLTGYVYDADGSLAASGVSVDSRGRVNGVQVQTTYSLPDRRGDDPGFTGDEDGNRTGGNDLPDELGVVNENDNVRFMIVTTQVVNNSGSELPIFTVNDVMVHDNQGLSPFVPYPDWGHEVPEVDERQQRYAYPHYVQLIPTAQFTAAYTIFDDLTGVVMAEQETLPEERLSYTYVGRSALPTGTLAPGAQYTYIRKMAAFNNTTPLGVNNAAILELGHQPPASSPMHQIGGLSFVLGSRSAPGGRWTLSYINQSVSYFNGQAYVPLEAGRTYPYAGELSMPSNARLVQLPAGQIAFSAEPINNEPFYTELVTEASRDDEGNIITDEDNNVVTQENPIIITAGEQRNLPAIQVAENTHVSLGLNLATTNQRELLGRTTFTKADGSLDFTLGLLPRVNDGNKVLLTITRELTTFIPLGTYNVYMSHGPLHNVNMATVTAQENVDDDGNSSFAADPSVLSYEMAPVIEFPGYFAADFDSRTTLDRIGLMEAGDSIAHGFAEDLDVIFFPDTDVVSPTELLFRTQGILFGAFDTQDNENDVDSLFDEIIATRATATLGRDTEGPWGRFALLSLPREDQQTDIIVPPFERTPNAYFDSVRDQIPGALIQVVRPRNTDQTEGGYFTALATRAGLPLDQPIPVNSPVFEATAGSGSATRAVDFDLLQVLAGNRYDEYLLTRADWFNLLESGTFKPATGGSSAGRLRDLPMGAVRTWVAVENTAHRDNDLVEFWTNAAAGRSFVSNGPLIEADVNGASFGQDTNVSGNQVTLNLKITAAPWIPVREVRVIVNGVAQDVNVALSNEGTVRFDGQVTLELDGSRRHWIVVEAGAAMSELANPTPAAEPGVYGIVQPGHLPLAFGNPIFVQN